MIDLSQIYRDIGRPWTHDDLAVSYATAIRRGEQLISEAPEIARGRPIGLLASAIPSTATLNVAIHLVHALPDRPREKLAEELVGTAATNATDALHRCHLALEFDARGHGYSPEDWMSVIYEAAAPLLESSRLNQEPPSVVRHAQEMVHWLSRSIACADEDSRETTTALADTLARLLVVCVFAEAATRSHAPGN